MSHTLNLSPLLTAVDLAEVHTVTKFSLGTRKKDRLHNEYIYLEGVASVVADDACTYTGAFKAARLAGNAIGPVAIAKAAIAAARYGWFQIYGNTTINSDTTASGTALYIDGTTGRVDDAKVVGDLIVGAYATAADASNKLPAFINYPFVTDAVPAS